MAYQTKIANPEISKSLVVSTGHITEQDSLRLTDGETGLVVYAKGEYGWHIHVPFENEEDLEDALTSAPFSDALKNLLREAAAHGCGWLTLDCDGPEYEGFPKFGW